MPPSKEHLPTRVLEEYQCVYARLCLRTPYLAVGRALLRTLARLASPANSAWRRAGVPVLLGFETKPNVMTETVLVEVVDSGWP